MTDARHPFPPIDPDRPGQIILTVGRMRSGKSVNAREMFRNWPQVDRLVIDPTGDADPGAIVVADDLGRRRIVEPIEYRGKLPDQLPRRTDDGLPVVARWIADPSSPTYRDDLDRAVALGLFPKERSVLLWIDDAGEVFPANRTGPHARTLLHQSRHWNCHAILTCPRPITIDPLCLAQAERVVMYDLPNPSDRGRVADTIGWDRGELADALNETKRRGAYWYTLYVAAEHSLYRCPPLPISPPATRAERRESRPGESIPADLSPVAG